MFSLLVAASCLLIPIKAAPQTFGLSKLDSRIVGGEPTTIEEYPYQASLQYFVAHRCGAVVLNEVFLVTVAHCTESNLPSYLRVRVGSTNHNSGGWVIQVAEIYQHPLYDNWLMDYDISIVRVDTPLTLGTTIAPVRLPELNRPIVPGEIGRISGWGTLSDGGPIPDQLQVVEVPLVSQEECIAAYSVLALTERMVCAGVPEGGKDACQLDGDSGSPLVVNGELIGLVSWGACARPNLPGVYTSVPALRDYITEITGL